MIWGGLLAAAVGGCGSVSSSSNGTGGAGTTGTAGTKGDAGTAGGAGTGAAGSTGGAGTTAGAGAAGAAGTSGAAGSTGAAGSGSTSAPAAFALKTPKSGDPTVSTAPMLTWEAAAGAATYDVEIATKPTFGADDVAKKTGLTGTTLAVTDALTAGVVYYWRATAVNAAGSTPASNAPFAFSSPADAGPSPHGVAVTPDGKTAVVSNDKTAGSVTLLDLAAFTKETVTVAGHPGMVAVTPDGARALVAEGSPNDVVIIDLGTKAVAGKITPPCVATTLYGLAVRSDGGAALIPDFSASCTKDVLDVAALPGGAITTTVDLGSTAGAFGVGLSPDGKTAFLTRGILGTSITRVDFGPNGVAVQKINGTSSSFGAAVTPDGKEALISSGEQDTIKRVSLATSAVTGTIEFDSNQDVGNIAVTSDGKLAVVVSDFEVGVLSLADGKVAARHSLAGRSVAVTPDGGRALVTGAGATGKLYVIKLP